MKIIHIASFKGNIGDRINHKGFYKILNKLYGDIQIEQVEIRDFYFSSKNRMFFDLTFAKKINEFDLCVLGGGGFFDVQWSDSKTGVTMDLSEEFINKITVPVIVNAMGYHEYPGVTTDDICNKFYKFISFVLTKTNWFITVRNDGSYERLVNRYGMELAKKIVKVPDNGFFCEFSNQTQIKDNITTVGICITNDLFSCEYNREVDTAFFNKKMADFIDAQAMQNRRIILLPHTPADINVISTVFSYLKSETKRNNIVVAPYNASENNAIEQLGEYYKRCDCIIGMRFHSLVSSIRLKRPAIALAGHRQIEALYEDLKLEEYCVRVDNKCFTDKLNSCLELMLCNEKLMNRIYNDIYENYLDIKVTKYERMIQEFIS